MAVTGGFHNKYTVSCKNVFIRSRFRDAIFRDSLATKHGIDETPRPSEVDSFGLSVWFVLFHTGPSHPHT